MALAALLVSCHQAQLPQLMDAAKTRWKRAACPSAMPRVTVVWGPHKMQCGDNNDVWGCHWNGGKVAVAKSTPEHYILQVLTHEYGHALDAQSRPGAGVLDHVPAGHGLMGVSISAASSKITQADIRLVCRNRVCLCERPEE